MSDNTTVRSSTTISAPQLRSLVSLLAYIIIGMIIGNAISLLLMSIGGINMTEVLEGSELNLIQRNFFRLGLLFSHGFTFIIPGIIFCFYFLNPNWQEFIKWKFPISMKALGLWSLVLLCCYPLLGILTQWNDVIPFPDWVSSSQGDAFALLNQTLNMEHWSELFLSFLLVGVFAAVGEELIFRGIVQRILESRLANVHVAIIISSLLFGSFHMQFERVLPLSFLGLILGYSYYYSKTILMPILLHLLNNSFQLLSIYIITRNNEMPDINEIPDIPIIVIALSILLTVTLFYLAVKSSSQFYNEPRP